MSKSNFLRNVATMIACLAVMTACNSGSKKQSGDISEAKTETQTKIPKGKLEIAAEVPPILTQYNLTVDALKPAGAVSVEVAYGKKEDVYFLLAKGTESNLKADFTGMLDAIKAAADDGKIYNYLTDDMEFDPALVDGYSLGHRVKYICKGKPVQVYLSYSYNYKPGDKNSPPAYGILFNYGQGQ
jgi:hypothetical protein